MSDRLNFSSPLKNIAATASSRCLRRWCQLIVRLRARPAVDDLPKGFAKVIAQESV